MKSYLKSVIVILIASVSINVQSQFNLIFKKGYIITLSNDTLFGFINEAGGIRNSKFCVFKADANSIAKKYYPQDIKSYRIIDGKFYSSKEVLTKNGYQKAFLEVLLDGEVSLYYYWKNKPNKYYIETKESKLIGLSHIMQKLDKKTAYDLQKPVNSWVELDFYKDSLYALFSNSKKIQDQVIHVQYDKKPLMDISKAYINETCKGNKCINYEKDLSISRPYLGVFTGVHLSQVVLWESLYYSEDDARLLGINKNPKTDIITTIPIGILYNFPLALFSDRFSFQIELITSSFKYKQESLIPLLDTSYKSIEVNSRMLELPLLLKYKLQRKVVSPTIAVGKTTKFAIENKKSKLYNIQSGGWFIELGMNYKISPKFSLFSNVRVQSIRSMVINDSRDNNKSFFIVENENKYAHLFKTNIIALYIGVNL